MRHHLPLSDRHPVVVHLVDCELLVGVQSLDKSGEIENNTSQSSSIAIHWRSTINYACEAFLSMSCNFPRVPHQMPESRA